MNYFERCNDRGIKLELSPQKARNCWKKTYKGKTKYYGSTGSLQTKKGYEEALREWYQYKSEVDGTRPNAPNWHHYRKLFNEVQQYHDSFGGSANLIKQVNEFLKFIDETLQQSELPYLVGNPHSRKSLFQKEFVADDSGYESFGHDFYKLPERWHERLLRLKDSEQPKRPQTIGYWFDEYIKRTEDRRDRVIDADTADDRIFKLVRFKQYADHGAHITTIDADYLERFHKHIDTANHFRTGKELSKSSKGGYWKAFKMIVRWCSQQSNCDLVAPANLDSREFTFREPKGTGRKRQAAKKLLWTPEEFEHALNLPDALPAFLILMLNCGFRHTDLGNLLHSDLHLDEKRILIQRHKLNQQDTAPVISYLLWDRTVELIKKHMTDDGTENVFLNARGGSVEDSLKSWWKDTRHKHGFADKRLDQLRKTGSTIIARHDRQLDELYLGESLSTTARIHYSFNDGETCKELDVGLRVLGAEFGFCEQPLKKVELTAEMIIAIKQAGIELPG